MKIRSYLFCLCLGITVQGYAQKVVSSKALKYDEDIRYEKGSTTPFTGVVKESSMEGVLIKEEYLENGIGVKGKEFDVDGKLLFEFVGDEKKSYLYNGTLMKYENDSIERNFYTNGKIYQEKRKQEKGDMIEECQKTFSINGQLLEQKDIRITKVLEQEEESKEIEVTTQEFYVTGELYKLKKHNQTNGEMYVKYYHLNGAIMTEFPLKDFKRTENKETEYYANGQLYRTVLYDEDDEEENVRTYRADGTLLSTEEYDKHDLSEGLNGVEKYYDKEGKLAHTVKIEDGSRQGDYYYDINNINDDKLYCQIGSATPFTGTEKRYYSNGLLHKEVDFVKGKVVGERKEYSEDGRLREESQQAVNDRLIKGVTYHENGVVQGKYRLNKGFYELEQYSSQGVKEAEGLFREDEQLIMLTKYHVNTGHIASVECKLEEEKRVTETYGPDGQMIAIERWLGRYQDGITEMIAEDGLTEVELEFKNGVKHGIIRMSIKGVLILDMKYKDGKVDGVVKMYGLNGQLKMEANYKDGAVVGKVKEYKIDEKVELPEETLKLIGIMFL